MNNLPRILTAILLLFFALNAAWAQRVELLVDETDAVKDPPESVELQYQFKVGDIRRYDITVDGDGHVRLPGQSEHERILSRTEMIFLQRARAYVPDEGVWRMNWDMIKGDMEIPEFGKMVITAPPVTFEMDKYGAVSKWKALEDFGIAPSTEDSQTLTDIFQQLKFTGFPKKAVSVDDEWEEEYTLELPDMEPITIKSKSRLLGYEKVKETDCAKIHTAYEIPFKLELKSKAAKASTAPAAGAEPKEDTKFLVGTEKLEYWTHFDYKEGMVVQSFGKLEINADVKTAEEAQKPAEPKKEEVAPPRDPSAGEPPPEPPKHDVQVEYRMISKFNPEKARFQEVEK